VATGDQQRRRLLEGKAALDPSGTSSCFFNWSNTTFPCQGDYIKWAGVLECSNWMVVRLNLPSCNLTGTLPSTWGARPGLEALDDLELGGNQLGGSLPAAYGNLTALWNLRLNVNKLTGTLPASWGNLAGLGTLDLASNQLQGTLPGSWGALKALRELDLRGNRLQGTLPASWGGMTNVYDLRLQDNSRLTGTIPCSWTNMGSKSDDGTLAYLSVAGTGLTGCFPKADMNSLGASEEPKPSRIRGVRGDSTGRMGAGCMQVGEGELTLGRWAYW
jgi:hypothetical protein